MRPTTPSGHLLKVPVVVKPEYVIALEQWKAVPFIHCDINVTWTPKVKRQLQADFRRLFELHGGPFVALHDPSDRKHEKFLRLMGFRHIDDLPELGLEVWNVEKHTYFKEILNHG